MEDAQTMLMQRMARLMRWVIVLVAVQVAASIWLGAMSYRGITVQVSVDKALDTIEARLEASGLGAPATTTMQNVREQLP